jgi:putative transposase
MRLRLFEKDADYEAFEGVLDGSLERPDAPRLLGYCLMPNHWHVVVQAGPRTDLSTWMQWVTVTHTHRWHAYHNSAGEGPLYQGRFKSFPVEDEMYFLVLCRYVEANALRAGLVARAEAWRWGSLWVRRSRETGLHPRLAEWPVDRPRNWLAEVNRSQRPEALSQVRRSVTRSTPLGSEGWRVRTAARLGLDLTVRPRGRPRNKQKSS